MSRRWAVLAFFAASCSAARTSAQTAANRPEPSLVVDAIIEYAGAPGMPGVPSFEAPADSLVSRLKDLWLLPREAASTNGRVAVAADCEPQIGIRNPSIVDASAVAALNAAALEHQSAIRPAASAESSCDQRAGCGRKRCTRRPVDASPT